MSVELVETIKQQVVTLSRQERSELSRFLEEQQEKDNLQIAPAAVSRDELATAARRRQQHLEWMKTHREEYGGQYVALDGDRLLGTGRNYPEAAAAASTSSAGQWALFMPKLRSPRWESLHAGAPGVRAHWCGPALPRQAGHRRRRCRHRASCVPW